MIIYAKLLSTERLDLRIAVAVSSTALPAGRIGTYLLLFLGGVGLCLAHRPAELPFTFDNQIYFYISERVASGVSPHVSLVDHKFALSSILSGAAIAAGRLAGINDVVSLRVLSIVAASASVVFVAALSFQLMRSYLAIAIAGLVMLAFNDFFLQGAMGARPKLFVVLFASAALYTAAREKHLLAGMLAGAATLCWQPAFLVALSLLVSNTVRRGSKMPLLFLVAGGATILCAYEGYFLWHGTLGEQLTQSFPMAADSTTPFRKADTSLAFIVGEGTRRDGVVRVFPVLFLVTSVAGLLWAPVRPAKTLDFLRSRPACVATVIGAYLALIFTILDHQAYPDRFILYPFMGLCGAWTVDRAVTRLRGRRAGYTAAAFAVAVSVYVVVTASVHVTTDRRITLMDQVELAKEVGNLTDQHGSVWAVNCVHLLGLNHQANHTPYGNLFDLRIRRHLRRQLGQKPYLPLKDGELPRAILISRAGEYKAIGWLPMAYRQVQSKQFARHGIRLWLYEGFKAAPNG